MDNKKSEEVIGKPNKPVSMLMEELKTGIEIAINDCGLPACVVENILFNYWIQIKNQSTALAAEEKKRYEEGLNKYNGGC